MPYSAASILAELDADARRFGFPGFNNMNYHMAAARQSTFRDDERWAWVFELIVWWPAADGMQPVVWAYGNCIERRLFAAPTGAGMVSWPISTIEVSRGLLGGIKADSIRVRGKPVTLRPGSVVRHEQVPERDFDCLVALVESHRDELFATDEELRAVVPRDLPLLLRLDDWHHPNVYLGKRPSSAESMRMIAQALETGDPRCYQPNEKPNVDYRLWLER